MTIGERIKLRRKELGLTQTELAEKMGLTSKTTICKAETKDFNPTMDRVKEFAKALDTTPAYLMGWEDNSEEETKSRAQIHRDIAKRLREMEPKLTSEPNKKLTISSNGKIIVTGDTDPIDYKYVCEVMSNALDPKTNKALELYKLFENAIPQVQAAVENLLRSSQQ